VDQLGPNALGEVLEPGRVADCYLGLLLPPGPPANPSPAPPWSSPRPRYCILGFPNPTVA
jgi:hypothetical protein